MHTDKNLLNINNSP